MTDTHTLAEREPANAADPSVEPRRFRGETFDAALADAHDALGPGIEVIAANRIRRGGLGGFFATDLGVEITVATTAAPALDRFDPQVALDERAAFEQRVALDQMIGAMPDGSTAARSAVATVEAPSESGATPTDVFELTDEGMDALLAEIAESADRGRMVDSASFASHLASADAGPWPDEAWGEPAADPAAIVRDVAALTWPDEPTPDVATPGSDDDHDVPSGRPAAAVPDTDPDPDPDADRALGGRPEVAFEFEEEWEAELRLDHEAFRRADAHPDPVAEAAAAEERAARAAVAARRTLVANEIGARPPGNVLSAPKPVPSPPVAVAPGPVTSGPVAQVRRTGTDDGALADLDELLRSVGVSVDAGSVPDAAAPSRQPVAPETPVAQEDFVTRLVELAAVARGPGAALAAVRVAITTPDGIVVELSVEGCDV